MIDPTEKLSRNVESNTLDRVVEPLGQKAHSVKLPPITPIVKEYLLKKRRRSNDQPLKMEVVFTMIDKLALFDYKKKVDDAATDASTDAFRKRDYLEIGRRGFKRLFK